MTLKLIIGDEIRNQVLKILTGAYMWQRRELSPELKILVPYMSDVEIELSEDWNRDVERGTYGDIGAYWHTDLQNIKSINLSYAMLLLKLHVGAEISIVTLPPDKISYPDRWERVQTLLDFLDEIGCNIFVNPMLHAKLLLANDLALLGSFNLSISALYNREEIGVSIDDLDNLNALSIHCDLVIEDSQRYGYSSLLNYGKMKEKSEVEHYNLSGILYINVLTQPDSPERSKRIEELEKQAQDQLRNIKTKSYYSPKNGVTRGWLLDYLTKHASNIKSQSNRREFFDVAYDDVTNLKSYSSNLDLFYLLSLRKLISSPEGKSCVRSVLGYSGDESTDSIMEFVNSKLVRKTIPDIRLRVRSLH